MNVHIAHCTLLTEDSYRKEVMVDESCALLDILDTAGQEEYSSMQDQWMREGKGFLLVYSITSQNTYDEITLFKDKILRAKDMDKVPMYASIVTILQSRHAFSLHFVINTTGVCPFFVVIDSVPLLMPAVLCYVHRVLVGNKCDLETEREVSTEQGKKLAIEWGCPFMEVSAKERVSVYFRRE
jgi:GTPase KRas protein